MLQNQNFLILKPSDKQQPTASSSASRRQVNLSLFQKCCRLPPKTPNGDQAIFLRAKLFQEISGFAPMPIIEDFDLIQRLKQRGKIAIAFAKVVTSARRWHKLGAVKTTVVNQLIILGYYWGVSPQKLGQ